MDEVLKFLTDSRVFYLATVDNRMPRVRPFGFVMKFEEKLYFCTGNSKDVFRQLKANPEFEVSSISQSYEWIRLRGKAVFDNNMAAKVKAFEIMPMLADIYEGGAECPDFEVFYLQDGQASFYKMGEGMEPVHTVKIN